MKFTSTTKNGKWILLPIEVKVRELEPKLLFSCIAAELGFNVIIGLYGELNAYLKLLPKGIYIEKSLAPGPRTSQTLAKNLSKGNIITSWDEEGLLFFNEDIYSKTRLSKENLSSVDLFFTWGENHSEVIGSKYPCMSNKLIDIGNPRIDALKSGYNELYNIRMKEIYKKLGPYILINTNFAIYNHSNGHDFMLNKFKTKFQLGSNEIEFYKEQINYEKALINHYVELIKELSHSFPDYNIILRPHPGENKNFWHNYFSKWDNIKIIHEGSSIPWIKAAEAVIHTSCTTGIESFLLKTPVFAFKPIVDEEHELYLPNALSEEKYNIKSIIEQLKVHLNKESESIKNYNDKLNIAKRYISNLEGPLSSEQVIEHLSKLDCPQQRLNFSFIGASNILIQLYTYLKRTSFPELSPDEIQETFLSLKKSTNRFKDLEIDRIANSLYCISKINK